MDIDKDPDVTEPTWESIYPTPDPTPDPSISYLSNTDICLPVRSEGVENGKSIFAMFPMEKVPDLPDIEPAIIDEIMQQQNENYRNLKGHNPGLLSTKMKPKDTRFLDVNGSSGIKPTNTEGS
jgi:hypothetical protein